MLSNAVAPLRLLLDTNIIVSGLLWNGAPRILLKLAADNDAIALFTSDILMTELRNTLSYRKFAKRLESADLTVDNAVTLYRDISQIVEPEIIGRVVPKDADDDDVVAAALGARAHAIVSGDHHLTEMEHAAGIAILRAADAIRLIEMHFAK